MPLWRRILGRIVCTLFWHSTWCLVIARSTSGLEVVLCKRCWCKGISHAALGTWFPHSQPGLAIHEKLTLTPQGQMLMRGWPVDEEYVGPGGDDDEPEEPGDGAA